MDIKNLKKLFSDVYSYAQEKGVGFISSSLLFEKLVEEIFSMPDDGSEIYQVITSVDKDKLLTDELLKENSSSESMKFTPDEVFGDEYFCSELTSILIKNMEYEARNHGGGSPNLYHLFISFSKLSGSTARKNMSANDLTYNKLVEALTAGKATTKTKMKKKDNKSDSKDPNNFFSSILDSLKNMGGESGSGNLPPFIRIGGELPEEMATSGDTKEDPIKCLKSYAKNLNELALADKFDKVQGREKEIDLLIKYLACKKKNNVILLGEPGVGKTTIVEGLVQRIVKKEVPNFLLDKEVYSLDLNALVAGTKYRGQYEERLQGIIKAVTENSNIIVYVDEFHNLIGNGNSEGNGDAANILKPYLARGEFQCIGSTTFAEYHKFIEKDGALKRRFNNISVYEPTYDETVEILKTASEKYGEFHGVTYDDEIINLCVSLSQKFISDRFLPDKAIDILDLSGSEAKLAVKSKKKKISKTTAIKNKTDEIRKSLEKEDWDEAVSKFEAKKKLVSTTSPDTPKVVVSEENVFMAISKISGVPYENIGQSDLAKLREMKTTLAKTVIGQEEAVKTVITSLQKNSLGFRDPKKPIANILLAGPSGTGKTYLCKQVAKEFFGSENALIRFDMSEYTEKHEITKLIGASASYVGYDDEPLFYAIKKRPYSVVLFDEIEKADRGIFPILLSILDEGYVTTANGTKIDFKNTIVILTSNVGTKELQLSSNSIGFGNPTAEEQTKRNQDIIMKSIKKLFAPEFINRLSNIVFFNKLTNDDLMKICDLELSELNDRLKSKGWNDIKVSDKVKEILVKSCDTDYGARDLQREISKKIEESICEYLLSNDVPAKCKNISLDVKSDEDITVSIN